MIAPLHPKDSSVLVVEDSPEDAFIVGKALERFGIRKVYAADNAEDGLKSIAKRAVDIALIDYNLPGMNGLRLLERIREARPETRVIIVTGVRDEHIAVAAMKAGAADYVTKD
ncbi:MAG: response regulator, partial [Dehalococcoidia bacterium]|nr:response regulator [Dehalococcoidia bacterium]